MTTRASRPPWATTNETISLGGQYLADPRSPNPASHYQFGERTPANGGFVHWLATGLPLLSDDKTIPYDAEFVRDEAVAFEDDLRAWAARGYRRLTGATSYHPIRHRAASSRNSTA